MLNIFVNIFWLLSNWGSFSVQYNYCIILLLVSFSNSCEIIIWLLPKYAEEGNYIYCDRMSQIIQDSSNVR